MNKSFDFTITDELRTEYAKFLRGETTYEEVKQKYNISLYQLKKFFNIMYFEKTKQLNYMKLT